MNIPKVLMFFFLVMATFSARAEDYFREKWFDYPDPTTAPRTTISCAKEGSVTVSCPTTRKPLRTCRKTGCIGPTTKIDLLRVSPTFVVSGPSSGEEAVKRAVQAIAVGCATNAIITAKGAAAITPSPEPAARVGAGLASGVGYFKACIAGAKVAAVASGIVDQLEFKIESPTHWSPL